MYLTFEEYQNLGFRKILDKEQFKNLEVYAEMYINGITNNYFISHDLETNWQTQLFKKAMAMQCEYLYLAGGTSIKEIMAQSPTSVSIGRLHLDMPKAEPSTVSSTMVCTEAYRILATSGLLFRKVDVL
ncbi:hypothetical protein QQG09_07990 [Melissococcus plutonius]|uniref:hypothetical protein n=1 Tax=Melissococcus plutonius TaxID=33970 RepID=UPI0021E55FC0|nr:hypothetical protein [Melissococcus plutonius]MCV2505656.1 hypothetical protein [Melissococcus plutonius]